MTYVPLEISKTEKILLTRLFILKNSYLGLEYYKTSKEYSDKTTKNKH
jgi:hypothetical protein